MLNREGLDGYNNLPSFIMGLIGYIREQGLSEKGIFRQVGNHTNISALKHTVDRGGDVDFSACNIHDLTSLLKKYLGDLPEPVLTFNLFHKLIETGNSFTKLMLDV